MPDDSSDTGSREADEDRQPEGRPGSAPRQKVDPAEYRERIDRVTELFSSMMETATEQATRRCPYKDGHDQCTASFGCRNQRKPEVAGDPLNCAGDDALDYRGAWDTT